MTETEPNPRRLLPPPPPLPPGIALPETFCGLGFLNGKPPRVPASAPPRIQQRPERHRFMRWLGRRTRDC